MLEKWYWILPNSILYNLELTDKQKLLFVCISSLCAERWYCFAWNDWFVSKWFSKNWETITRNLKEIEKLWFIKIIYTSKWSIVKQRIITIDSKVNDDWFLNQSEIDSKVNYNNTITKTKSNKKENNIKEFLEFIENNPLWNTSKIADRFIKLWWEPKESVDSFREWLTNLSKLHWVQPNQLNDINEKWFVYWLWRDDKKIKNFKTTFWNCPYLPKNKTIWTKSK